MDPYDLTDRKYTAGMVFDREDHNGDRFYTYGVRNEQGRPAKQVYFYRAMRKAEADGWLSAQHNAAIDGGAHQGWASFRGYSLEYFTRRNGYTHLLEVYAPDFLPWLAEIGINVGKVEGGDMSWGVGGRASNGFRPSRLTNVALAELYTQEFRNRVIGGGPRGKAKALTPIMFRKSIKWAKLVNFRSERA